MKRDMGGGSLRGPVALARQRRSIRFVQVLLVVIAAVLLMLAGYALGTVRGYAEGRRSGEIGPPRRPSIAEPIVLGGLGLGAFGAALVLQGGGGVRLPTPARLDELAGRAERVAVERAEEPASDAGEPDLRAR